MSIITMGELKAGMCRWPFGHPENKDFRFCGEACDPGSPYCPEHMAAAKAPARKPKAV